MHWYGQSIPNTGTRLLRTPARSLQQLKTSNRGAIPRKGANDGSSEENACGAGHIGLAVCRTSLDLGCNPALEECPKAVSSTSASHDHGACYHACGPSQYTCAGGPK